MVTSRSIPRTASAVAAIVATSSAGDGQHDGVASGGADQGGEGVRVGADDAALRDWLARHGDLVAGGQDGDARAAVHADPGMVGGGGEADIAGGHAPAGGHDRIAGGEILAGAADVADAR